MPLCQINREFGRTFLIFFKIQHTWRNISGEGAQWNNFDKAPSVDDNFSLGGVMLVLVMDIFFHILITWYVGNVFPGEFGIPRPFYFPFTVNIEIKIYHSTEIINVLCSFNNNVLQFLMNIFNILCTEVILGLL